MTFDELSSQWMELVSGKRSSTVDLQLDAVLESQNDSRGGSLPFKGLGSDGEVYWIKQSANRQSTRVPVTEQLVSGVGRLIGAPVCETRLINIPAEFDGETLDNGTILASGIAHASRDVAVCSFEKWYEPHFRSQDDNRRRHAGYFALYDWCWGDDMQWLYDLQDDRKTYSHDHGHFLPGAPDWTIGTLANSADLPHELDADSVGLDDHELLRIADRLESLTQRELSNVFVRIPLQWSVTDRELAAAGAFFDYRREHVACRLRALATKLRSGS